MGCSPIEQRGEHSEDNEVAVGQSTHVANGVKQLPDPAMGKRLALERDQHLVRRSQGIDGQYPQRRGAVDEDEVVVRGDLGQRCTQHILPRWAFMKGDLRAGEVNGARQDIEVAGHRTKGHRSPHPAQEDIVNRKLKRVRIKAQRERQARLRVKIDDQNALPELGKCHPDGGDRRGLGHPALLVGHRDRPGHKGSSAQLARVGDRPVRPQPILPGVSIPPFIAPPLGVRASPVTTSRGAFAALDNRAALDEPAIGSAVLVPGFTGSKEDFLALLLPLAQRRVRAVAFDLSGQFETPGPDGPEGYSLAGFAADSWAVAATLPRPLVMVGHSFGGLVVRDAILADPLAADGLAIIASGPAALPEGQAAVLQMFADVMNRHGLEAVLHGKRAMEAAAGAPPLPPDLEAFLTRRFLANNPGSLQAMIETLCEVTDQIDVLAKVAPPTVVIVGDQDDAWPPAEQRVMAQRLKATLLELTGVGHSPAVDDPVAVAEAVAALYSGV